MNDKFFDLKKEKQDRMINAALKYFGLYGYRFASTDDIVKEAGISKGLLFHYFESKLGLYSFVYDYSVRYMSMELNSCVSQSSDFFQVMREIENGKLQVLRNYPYMQFFLDRCDMESIPEALLAIEDKRAQIHTLYQKFLEQVTPPSLLNEEDFDSIYRMLRYTIQNHMSEHLLGHSFHAEMVYRENLSYINLIERLVSST